MAIFSDCSVVLDLKNVPFKERKKLMTAILDNGGDISYVVNQKCSFVVATSLENISSSRWRSAQKHQTPVVSVQYVWSCLEKGLLLPVQEHVLEPQTPHPAELKFRGQPQSQNSGIHDEKAEIQVKDGTYLGRFRLFKENDDDMPEFSSDFQVAKYSVLVKAQPKTWSILELQSAKGQAGQQYRVVSSIMHEAEKSVVWDKQVHSCSSEDAVEAYLMLIKELQVQGFTPTQTLPVWAEKLTSHSLQQLLLEEKLNCSTISQEVAVFVELIWTEALGSLSNILTIPVTSISLNDVSRVEGLLLQVQKSQCEDEVKGLLEEVNTLLPLRIREPDSKNKLVSQKLDLCQLIRDILNMTEVTLGNPCPSSLGKYRALRCSIEQVPSQSPEFQSVCQLLQDRPAQIQQILRVSRGTELHMFKNELGNIKPLLHSTASSSLVGILSRGLLLPRVGVEQHGIDRTDIGNLGSGIYFSDSLNTSVKYSKPSVTDGCRLLLVCEVALGQCKDLHKRDFKLTSAPEGYNSVHGVRRTQNTQSDFEVVIFQTYTNNSSVPIEAKYVFPLEETAAVCGFEAFINGKHVIGKVKEKEQARKEYKQAIEKGHGAYLMDQDAPDVFTISVGNLPPGATVLIKVTFITELVVRAGTIIFSLPGSVAPWQQSSALNQRTQTTVEKVCVNELQPEGEFSLCMSIEMPYEIINLECSHQIKIKRTDCKAVVSTLPDQTLSTDGFRLSFTLFQIHMPRMWVEKHPEKDTEACMLVFYPHFESSGVSLSDVSDVIIVLDTSESMRGDAMLNARRIALKVLNSLDRSLRVNIISFGSDYKEAFPSPNLLEEVFEEAKNFIKSSDAVGGSTELWRPLRTLNLLPPSRGVRNVLLISDGHVQNQPQTLQLVRDNVRHTRFFTCGLNLTANRYMLRALAQAGGGTYEFFDTKTKHTWAEKVNSQVRCMVSPGCSSVAVKWQQFNPTAPSPVQAPSQLHALFSDCHTLVYGFVPHCTQATLFGDLSGQEIETMVSTTELQKTKGTFLHKLTARAIIRDYEDGSLGSNEAEHEGKKAELKSYIIELSKEFSILSQFTSFVAIEERDQEQLDSGFTDIPKIIAEEDVDILSYMGWTEQKQWSQELQYCLLEDVSEGSSQHSLNLCSAAEDRFNVYADKDEYSESESSLMGSCLESLLMAADDLPSEHETVFEASPCRASTDTDEYTHSSRPPLQRKFSSRSNIKAKALMRSRARVNMAPMSSEFALRKEPSGTSLICPPKNMMEEGNALSDALSSPRGHASARLSMPAANCLAAHDVDSAFARITSATFDALNLSAVSSSSIQSTQGFSSPPSIGFKVPPPPPPFCLGASPLPPLVYGSAPAPPPSDSMGFQAPPLPSAVFGAAPLNLNFGVSPPPSDSFTATPPPSLLFGAAAFRPSSIGFGPPPPPPSVIFGDPPSPAGFRSSAFPPLPPLPHSICFRDIPYFSSVDFEEPAPPPPSAGFRVGALARSVVADTPSSGPFSKSGSLPVEAVAEMGISSAGLGFPKAQNQFLSRAMKRRVQKCSFESFSAKSHSTVPLEETESYQVQTDSISERYRRPDRINWEELFNLQHQDGYWECTGTLSRFLGLDVDFFANVFLKEKGICSLGAKAHADILKLVATLLVLQLMRVMKMADGELFQSLFRLSDHPEPRPACWEAVKRAVEWVCWADRQYPCVCSRLEFGWDWESCTRQLLGLDALPPFSPLIPVLQRSTRLPVM
ncbi:protein mono-ADP-ribosyltransferase PARP4 isoform X3 [Pangasianodon hypophthalmus]|uniref:protein mono-ADP-ribosyltransferase PARP4 isoform X3 n=1 Tax=Pangasianodon hypophthalmus TaxID=310915 RepID=UPI002306F508|nr:protein mono-ADP-ribosyltransferase PARP4 isoform X3 [Pangasianodon hypophthalmus]